MSLGAQELSKVKGTVVNSSGTALEGVEVIVTSKTKSQEKYKTKTNSKGLFSFDEIPANAEYDFTFNYLDYSANNVSDFLIKEGENNSLMVRMEKVSAIDGVVITALGIKREEKKLGYAQQTIKSDDLTNAVSNNWSSGLKGKVAGLNTISAGTGPLNSQKLQLRGSTSLNQQKNYALIVIDGVPMDQEMTSNGFNSAAFGSDSPTDFGNSISELNVNDIETVTVLKGPAAAALYGSRASNGALIITTKSGKKDKGLGISFNSSVLIDKVNRWPEWQYEYGAGNTADKYYSYGNSEDGPATGTRTEAYGPRFDGQSYFQYDPNTNAMGTERTAWRAYKNNRKDFWETGVTFNNAVSLQGGNDKGNMRLSLNHTDNKWIMPNTGFKKFGASFNGNYKISDKVKISSVLNYNSRNSDNLPSSGYNNGTVAYAMLFLMPNTDNNWLKPIWAPGQENIKQLSPFSPWPENMYFIANANYNALESNQIVGNLRTDIELAPNLTFMGRVALNSNNQFRETKRAYSSNRHAKGYYSRQDVNSQEINADFLFTYNNKIGEDFQYMINAGGNRMDYHHKDIRSSVEGLVVPAVYKLSNGITAPTVFTNDADKRVNSLYGMLSLSLKNQIFVDITGRNDWSSTLPEKNNSFFYPSVSSSFILSDIFSLPKSISYLKYRLSFAQVGSDTNPYQTAKYFAQSSFPSSALATTTLYNADLKPELTASWETGIEYKMFNNRLGLDLTLYTSDTKNQIITVPTDITGGYNYQVINAGKVRNKGIEVMLTGTPIKNQNFQWDIIGNWNKNYNEVLELAGGVQQQVLATGDAASIIAVVGGSTTAIWGRKFLRDDQGNIIFANGVARMTPTNEFIANATPDWKAGLTNNFRYKNFKFSFTLDGQLGGALYSHSFSKGMDLGIMETSLPNRGEMITGIGVMQNADGSYSPNNVAVTAEAYYRNYYYGNALESRVFKTSYLKIREVALYYDLPKSILSNTKIQSLTLGIFGRDLKTFSDFPYYDPETSALNGNVFVQGVEVGQMPSTATYGFSLKVEL